METVLESATRRVVIGLNRPLVVIGERINPTGRRALTEELKAGRLETVTDDAMAQVAAGAQVLDVNAGVPGADEAALLVSLARAVSEVTDAPLCFDSSEETAIEAALAAYDGKALVNSVTGEERRLERTLPVVKRYGAAVVALLTDETGIPATPEQRLAVARRIVERAADHGIPAEDVVVDPVVMTVGTDTQAAAVTLGTIRLIRDELGANLVCGASNVSFGLPDRHRLNSAFIAMAVHAGLTAVIANPLVAEVRKAILGANLLLGRDAYAAGWIRAYRAEQAAVTG
ncbi:MAG: dihydropteroate synthase [Thermoleophilia bacterium]|nr:dihydropteroate synthase [Thermoleophilia bacterium]